MALGRWPTGNVITPTEYICRRVRIPDDLDLVMAVNGALLELIYAYNWEQLPGYAETPEQAASLMSEMYFEYLESDVCMIGAVISYASTTPPNGMLPCDGSIYQRVDYPRLYAVLDPAFIVDADQFQTPDLRGRFVFGVDAARAAGATGGAESHTLTELEMPIHSHTEIIAVATVINGGIEAPAPAATPAAGVTGSAGGSQPHPNMPPFLALRWGIVAR